MSIAMDRVEAYVFNFSDENSDQSPSDSSSPPSSASSSIGRNSDDGGKSSEDGGENEVESPYNGPLEMMESLEQVLQWKVKILHEFSGGGSVGVDFFFVDERLSEAGESLQSSSEKSPLSSDLGEQQDDSTWRDLEKPIMDSSRSALTLAMAVAAAAGVMTNEGSSSGGDSSPGSSPTTSGSPPRQRHHHQQQMMLPPLYPRSQGSFGNLTSSQSTSLAGFGA